MSGGVEGFVSQKVLFDTILVLVGCKNVSLLFTVSSTSVISDTTSSSFGNW
jgi:hypothetical protein